eukprot:Pgem_evm1s9524
MNLTTPIKPQGYQRNNNNYNSNTIPNSYNSPNGYQRNNNNYNNNAIPNSYNSHNRYNEFQEDYDEEDTYDDILTSELNDIIQGVLQNQKNDIDNYYGVHNSVDEDENITNLRRNINFETLHDNLRDVIMSDEELKLQLYLKNLRKENNANQLQSFEKSQTRNIEDKGK